MKRKYTILLSLLIISNFALSVPGPITTVGSLRICNDDPVNVPVTITNFNNVGIISLTLNYDPSIFLFQSVSLNPAISSGSIFTNGTTPGVFILSYVTDSGFSLPDNDTLFVLTFTYVGPSPFGSSALTWPANPFEANEYSMADGTPFDKLPFENYFINGLVTVEPLGCGLGGPRTTVGSPTVCRLDRDFSVPVTIANFNNVGIISLTLNYNPSYILFQSVDLNPAISSGSIFTNGTNPGTFILSYLTDTGISLSDDDTLFTLHFLYSGPFTPGNFPLTWAQTPPEANEYSSVEGIPFTKNPFESYFISGILTIDPDGCGVWIPLSDWPLYLAFILMIVTSVYFFRRGMIS